MNRAVPTAIKKKMGNPGKRKLADDEPVPPDEGMPEPPIFLLGYALDEWHRVCNGLHVMGVLYGVDTSTLAAYCVAYSQFRTATEKLKKSKYVLRTPNGSWQRNPLISIIEKASSDMVKYAGEFGMTPSARARMGIRAQGAKKSKFEGLVSLAGGKNK